MTNEPNEICDAANITFAPITCVFILILSLIKIQTTKLWGTCIVGCVATFVTLIITCETSIVIYIIYFLLLPVSFAGFKTYLDFLTKIDFVSIGIIY
jgi:hypothetical protein